MKISKTIAALLAAGCLLTGLAGCSVTTSKPLSMDVTQALEDYVEENLSPAESQAANMGLDLEITVEGNTLLYTYTSQTQMDNSDGSVTSSLNLGAETNADSFQDAELGSYTYSSQN